jgi:hypothetical protein
MAVYSLIGSKFELGAVVALKSADFLAADFTTPMTAAVEVKEPQTFGIFADEWTTSEVASVTDGRVRTLKHMRKGKPCEISFFIDPLDAGQLALRAAALTRDNYAMRLTLADKPATGASPKSSTRLFVGTITNVDDDASGTEGVMKVTIQPNSNLVVTHASAT